MFGHIADPLALAGARCTIRQSITCVPGRAFGGPTGDLSRGFVQIVAVGIQTQILPTF